MTRKINAIAAEIRQDWFNVNYAARPYLDAMFSLKTINDVYIQDSASSILLYFLSNAGTWRGETARRIKKEIKLILKNK